jgi:protein-tyrosine kinase
MSRNFDLMQMMERSRALLSQVIANDDTSHVLIEAQGRGRHRPLTSDAALSLVQRVFLQQTEPPPKLVVFAGVDSGSGCMEMAVSVAEILARSAPGAVCLVEANLRFPTLAGAINHEGLVDALRTEMPIRTFIQPLYHGGPSLLSSGSISTDSPQLLGSERLKTRFTELRAEFAFVVVASPPMTLYTDAIALGKVSDGIVLVIEAGSTHREAARTVVETFQSANIPILAAVLNNRSFPIPERIYKRL